MKKLYSIIAIILIILCIPSSVILASDGPDFPHFMYRMEVEDFGEDFKTPGKRYSGLPILDPWFPGSTESYSVGKYESNDSVYIEAGGLGGGSQYCYETLLNAVEAYFGANASQFIKDNFPREDFGIDDDKKTFEEIGDYVFTYLAGNNLRGYGVKIKRAPIFLDLIDWEDPTEDYAVIELYGEGIVYGIGNNLFAPSDNITRAQVAVLFTRAMGIAEGEYEGAFTDVPDGLYYTGAVEKMAELGYMTGNGDGYFYPGNTISYQDVFLLAYRYLRDYDLLPAGSWGSLVISDHIELDDYVREAINELYMRSLIRYQLVEAAREPGTRIRIAEFLNGVLNYIR